MAGGSIPDRGKPYIDWVMVKNDHSADLVDGDVVMWQTAADKLYGIDVIPTAGADEDLVAGVMKGTTPVGEYGRMQIYGYHGNVKSTGAIVAGDPVKVSAIAATVAAGAAADGPGGFVGVCLVAAASGRCGVILRLA